MSSSPVKMLRLMIRVSYSRKVKASKIFLTFPDKSPSFSQLVRIKSEITTKDTKDKQKQLETEKKDNLNEIARLEKQLADLRVSKFIAGICISITRMIIILGKQ